MQGLKSQRTISIVIVDGFGNIYGKSFAKAVFTLTKIVLTFHYYEGENNYVLRNVIS